MTLRILVHTGEGQGARTARGGRGTEAQDPNADKSEAWVMPLIVPAVVLLMRLRSTYYRTGGDNYPREISGYLFICAP